MRHYEVLFILKPTLTEDEAKAKLDFVKEVITKNGGEIASVIEMGTRKLAYTIKKYDRGNYFVIYFKAPANLIAELVRNLRITEEIIRFLTVKYENKLEISAWEKLSKGIKFSEIAKKERSQKEPRTPKEPKENQEQEPKEEN
ncbi:30S ribosomal protein S6 [Campylobacter sputorum subsp. bubulus]|uniref:Small ribosomal subunit protein bS6 n=1 Tax=Campylobacter sputorum subsp. sputorum TaxID=32024 RepID=A0A381DL86_9BACT|nr:30S ribosomal protein S6 [Campylobacter sputorum]ASM34683.1 30S ribosomal protein S6 [Campylobacter sputorum aubsp. sputorum RM3237]ASM36344.1 30S ribosomal protein S6 [Campylobacter sputorum bv. faecalis CCUG 20703]ASM38025.1 30S ribosomal protein S6 [Campylobacter sputorum bv. paraureolyticus LMG 11764]KAB0581755.1 30S ribosomal protein S6 [Campylobacter sputorum subsp. sputorum]MDY6120242.1 30S ribosomal protein S6 [Campylobacter sputorum]